MAQTGIAKTVREAIPYLAMVAAVVAGTAIYNYFKTQGIINFSGAQSYQSTYDPWTKQRAEDAYSFASVNTPDSSQILTRSSQSNLRTQSSIFRLGGYERAGGQYFPSNVDYHYNRIFYDRNT